MAHSNTDTISTERLLSEEWRDRAACLDASPELFFPVGTSESARLQLTRAKRVCAACPVRSRCLQWSIDTGVDHGVWGGLSEEERRSMKRRTARARIRAA
jgi:WhiB family redox-sensing transcriptional regulator